MSIRSSVFRMHVYDDVAAYADHCKSRLECCLWRQLNVDFSMCTAGVPERVGQKDWQRAGFEALSSWAYWEQPRWLVLGQSSDARAEHALGDGLQPLCVQTDTTRAGTLSGKTCCLSSAVTLQGVTLVTWKHHFVFNNNFPHSFWPLE